MRDYQIVSPSLEGVLNHDSLLYDGVRRPIDLIRVLDGPSSKGNGRASRQVKEVDKEGEERMKMDMKVLEQYFHDLYGVFMKRFSYFIVQSNMESDDSVKLQAMLQEMIKVRRWMNEGKR